MTNKLGVVQDAGVSILAAGWRESTTDQGQNPAQFYTNNNYRSIIHR